MFRRFLLVVLLESLIDDGVNWVQFGRLEFLRILLGLILLRKLGITL